MSLVEAPVGIAVVRFASDLATHGDRIALVTSDGELSYGELADRVHDMGRRLGPQRRLVLVRCANAVDPIVGYLAALANGHVVLLVGSDNPTSSEALIASYDPDVVLGRVAGRWHLEERREGSAHDLHPDLALLLCTSGSTGSPKLVRLSRENLQANVDAIGDYLDIRNTDRAATTLPMQYCYGLSVINSHLSRGAGIVLTELSVVDTCFWTLFYDNRCTSLAGVPYTFELLDRVGFPDMVLPHLRQLTQAGGRLCPDRVQRYAALAARGGWELFVMYGQTEATARMAYLPPHLAAERPQAIGIPIRGGSFALRPIPEYPDPDTGELVYSGPNVMLGYAQTRSDLSLGRTVETLRTGDIARRAADGLYEVLGRRSRFLKVFGLRIDLQQAEAVFAGQGITVVCAGTDDEVIVVHDGDHCPLVVRGIAVAEFGLPASAVRVCRVAELPRLPSGKPDYRAVSELTNSVPLPAPVSAPVGSTPAAADAEALRDLFADLLDQPAATLDSTFVSLGGDSLSYVEMSLRLEQALGHLPANWHTTPIRDLSPTVARHRSRGHVVETSIVLRAVGIILIVGTHVQLFNVLGSAHILIAVAGFNFARFQLTTATRRARLRNQLISIVRIAAPSMAWITVAFLIIDKYSVANVFLLNSVLGTETWNQQWHSWFLEVLLYVLVGMAAVLAIPWLDRAERRYPFGFVAALFVFALLARYGLLDLGLINPMPVLWLFALGWATARAATRWQRLLVTAAVLSTVPGFFGDPKRELVIIVGLALLVWVPFIRCPAVVRKPACVLAASSLYIYLTHWEIYPYLSAHHPLLAVIAALIAGIIYWKVATAVVNTVTRASTTWSGGRQERDS